MVKLNPRARKALKWGAIATAAAPVIATGAVVAIDEARKRRTPPTGEFPHLPPQPANVGENETLIFTYGRDLYEAMLADIEKAKEYVYFEMFILKADAWGYRFREAFQRAARRGVRVHVLLDTWGNLNQDPCFRHPPAQKNLHWMNFPLVRTGIFTGRSRDKGRDHRKIMVVDGRVGYVGGYNIGTIYGTKWRDTHMRIAGPGVWELEAAFTEMWNSYRQRKHPRLEIEPGHRWNPALRAVHNSPAQNVYPIAALYIDALARAKDRAWMTMGYFIPDDPMLDALTGAAQRGVDVRILIPQYSNHIYTDWVGRPHYERLLESGVRMFLYREAMIHAKTMTVDGHWSTIGTANIDRLSLRGNFEINMSIFSDDLARVMEKLFLVDLTNTFELTLEEWNKRGTLARVTESILRPLAPLL
ncbi:cardiolipin synthase [Actinobaculum suis]|uniref:Cardiolipin synthase n=1 Tax=Actinobaculum suis TaxID=1657 RepID=A0A0K9EQV8_9ACTO|nr:phospholipase D-like domain-containing protein [Actinobaculum suis]KMY22553.1 phospholipase [Actinobaculum suis]MDY5154103.1 phospholipase D-like domain-containing protein [Actinobaculum suis]SDE50079.1 cardiolipin synthase [Actinobaculum suis]VDG76950.1 cardiolipin synthetase [Actinobaculum suis]